MDHGFVLVRAKNQANGWVLALAHLLGFVVAGVEEHLAEVGVVETADFEIYEEEALKPADQGLFEVAFEPAGGLREADEFQHVGIFDEVDGLVDLMTFAGQGEDALFAAGTGEALEEEGVDLALKLADGPAGFDALDFVEAARFWVGDTDER